MALARPWSRSTPWTSHLHTTLVVNLTMEGLLMNREQFGASFTELTQEEMDFITGANGLAQPQATPTVVTSSVPCINITTSSWVCISGGISAISGLVSYTKRCI